MHPTTITGGQFSSHSSAVNKSVTVADINLGRTLSIYNYAEEYMNTLHKHTVEMPALFYY